MRQSLLAVTILKTHVDIDENVNETERSDDDGHKDAAAHNPDNIVCDR